MASKAMSKRRRTKKARREKPVRITDIPAAVRLQIYSYLDPGDIDIPEINRPNKFGYDYDELIPQPNESYEVETAFAAQMGDIDVLDYLLQLPDYKWTREKCVEQSELDFLGFLSVLFVYHGNFKSLKWSRTKNFYWDEWTFNFAVSRYDNMDMFQWLHRKGCPWSEETFAISVTKNNLDLCKWLRSNGCPWDEQAFEAAATLRDRPMPMMKWLRTSGCPWDSNTFKQAARRPDWEMIIWLRLQKCPWDINTFVSAITFYDDGEVDEHEMLIKWLMNQHCPCAAFAIDFCIFSDRLYIIESLVEDTYYREVFDPSHMVLAIKQGKGLEWLKTIRKAKRRWAENTFGTAIERGDISILRWLRQKNCPWGASDFTFAVETASDEIIRWMLDEQCPFDRTTFTVLMEKYMNRA